jgi:hypothetical protein
MMNYKLPVVLCLFLVTGIVCRAQKPFMEGTIIYKVTLASADNKIFSGTYTFFIKGNQVRKEIKLNNGYQDIVLLNSGTNKVYSLQNRNGKKYAIELSMPQLLKSQEKFNGFTVKDETNESKKIAGYSVYKANINYTDGTAHEVYYTKEWDPSQKVTFERFPNAKFLPMYFSYTDDQGMVMTFEAEKIEPEPIENAIFRIPADYKMISYGEYKQLSE